MLRARAFLIVLCLLTLLCAASADVVTDWNNVALDTIMRNGLPPTEASRALAMMHIAIYDSVNAIEKTHEQYYVEITPKKNTSPEAAAASAAHRMLTKLYPDDAQIYADALAYSLSHIKNGTAKKNGIALGKTVADKIYNLRKNDGSNKTVTYEPGDEPGEWRPTPADFAMALTPQWANVKPFAMTKPSQYRPGPPPSLTGNDYTANWIEVASLGAEISRYRTPDQTEIAWFWSDDVDSISPPGRWCVVAQVIAGRERNTFSENSRLFALLNIAMADCAISAWDCKYHYSFWRPITAIQEADEDGNPRTHPIRDWMPLLPTPPFPEYVSGHSTFGAGAAKVIASFYHKDCISFCLDSTSQFAGPRYFHSLSEAALENGRSRIYGGIHYQFANSNGLKMGRAIGDWVWANYLLPLDGKRLPAMQMDVLDTQ